MSGMGMIVSIASLLIAAVAWWVAWRLRQELSGIKRERYYLEQKSESRFPSN